MQTKCPTCGSKDWRRTTAASEIAFDEQTFRADVPASTCRACGEQLIASDDLARFESAVAQALASAGARSGKALKFMRKEVPVAAVEMADLMDVAPETLSRWETGERDAPRAYVATLVALVADKRTGSSATLERLRMLRERPKLAKVVKLELDAAVRR